MRTFLFSLIVIICTSCTTLSKPPSIEERDESIKQQMELIKNKYPQVKNKVGNPNQIYNYLMTIKDAKYAWKIDKKVIVDNVIINDSKFDGLLIDPKNEIDLEKFNVKEIEDINISDLIINVDMVLYISRVESTNLQKYEYIYTYKLIKDKNIRATNVYKYIKYFGITFMNTSEQYIICNNWE